MHKVTYGRIALQLSREFERVASLKRELERTSEALDEALREVRLFSG